MIQNSNQLPGNAKKNLSNSQPGKSMGKKYRNRKEGPKTRQMPRTPRSGTFEDFIEKVDIALGKKKNPIGRPTVKNNILLGRRDDIAQMLETDWALVGWKLRCLRNRTKQPRFPEEVRLALEPLREKHGAQRIAFLLRPTSIPATSDEVRRTYTMLGEARESLQTIRPVNERGVSHFKDVWRAYYETSGKYRQELKIEITRRIQNVVRLTEECADKERIRRKVEKQATPESELINAQALLKTCQEALRDEKELIRGLKDRLEMASDNNRSRVREMARAQLKRLRQTRTELQQLTITVQRLESVYEDQAAGFARKDFLDFSIDHRGRHHPRQIANALAGLPEMGCRQSVTTCRKMPFPRDPHPHFKVFEVIERVWKKGNNRNRQISELITAEISRIPKTWKFYGQRVPYFFRDYLQNNQLSLQKAIHAAWNLKPRPHPEEVPYTATMLFLESVSKQQNSALARVLSQSTSADG
jgi:hypothetical protein